MRRGQADGGIGRHGEITLAVLAAGGLVLALATIRHIGSDAHPAIATPPAMPAPVPHVEGGRLVYSAAAPLTLPDGSHQSVRSLLNVRRPLRFGDFVWNDDGVPAGSTWVRVDLARQTMSVFRDGHEIGTAIILYGTDGTPTPTGIFPILARAEHHRSSLYDAEMPYMLRLTHDGVAIHASHVREGSATHGCIGVPEAFAARLFATTRRGDRVVILG